MTEILAQLFVALAVSLTAGIIVGFTVGVRRPVRNNAGWPSAASTPPPEPGPDLREVVEREAELIEALARAEDDLHAHSKELADANEEIVCLLEQLHEARQEASQ